MHTRWCGPIRLLDTQNLGKRKMCTHPFTMKKGVGGLVLYKIECIRLNGERTVDVACRPRVEAVESVVSTIISWPIIAFTCTA